jgi:hypothetical protein
MTLFSHLTFVLVALSVMTFLLAIGSLVMTFVGLSLAARFYWHGHHRLPAHAAGSVGKRANPEVEELQVLSKN